MGLYGDVGWGWEAGGGASLACVTVKRWLEDAALDAWRSTTVPQ
jgi:hypothetical protein